MNHPFCCQRVQTDAVKNEKTPQNQRISLRTQIVELRLEASCELSCDQKWRYCMDPLNVLVR